jgi:hypothetical protein
MAKDVERIEKIADKYGLMLFHMGLLHMIDNGMRNFTDENVADSLKHIEAQAEVDKNSVGKQMLTPEIQREIVLCAAELSKFSITELFAYIKKYDLL